MEFEDVTQKEKDILYAKSETLRWSISDVQLQAVMAIVSELISNISVDDRDEMGFKGSGESLDG